METIRLTKDFHIDSPTAVSLGKFDGFHIGHRLLINRILAKKKEGMKSVIFTFDFGEKKALHTEAEREALLEKWGIDYLLICPIGGEIMHMEASDFIRALLVGGLDMKYAAVGTDFRFGYRRGGDPSLLKSMEGELGFETDIIDKAQFDGEDISSTRIRDALSMGRIDQVNRMLGFAWSVTGTVRHGRQLGRRLGMPTINIVPDVTKLLPPYGVYATKTRIAGEDFDGITNIGVKPTVGGDAIGIETYLFDLDKDLYGEELTVRFYGFERPEQKFDDIDALKKRIEKDVEWGRVFLGEDSI